MGTSTSQKRRVVITGASAGIGEATARRFAKAGFDLVLIARRKEKLETLRKEIGGTIYELDVTSLSQVEETIQKIGPIDILINNAGLALGLDKAQQSDLEEWEKCIDVNINGLVYCTHATLPGMVRRNKGHIINLGSTAGTYPYPGGNVYCASKAFVHQFSLCLRADLLGTPIRVTCIEAGLVGGTEFSSVRFRGDATKAKSLYEKTKPLTPEDIAETIFYCATAPEHVNINTIELMPVCQAFSPLAIHREP